MKRTRKPLNVKENISISVGLLIMALPAKFQNAKNEFYFEYHNDNLGEHCWLYSENIKGDRAGVRVR